MPRMQVREDFQEGLEGLLYGPKRYHHKARRVLRGHVSSTRTSPSFRRRGGRWSAATCSMSEEVGRSWKGNYGDQPTRFPRGSTRRFKNLSPPLDGSPRVGVEEDASSAYCVHTEKTTAERCGERTVRHVRGFSPRFFEALSMRAAKGPDNGA